MGSFGDMFNIERSLQKIKTNAYQSKIKLLIGEELKKDSGLKLALSVFDTSHYQKHCLWIWRALICVKYQPDFWMQIDWRNQPESDKK